jgi:GxxExxY protein
MKTLHENDIATILVDIFIEVHSNLGPGLLESVYESAICHELELEGLKFQRQQGIQVWYKEIKMDLGFRADIVVEEKVIVEVKSVESITPVFFKTLLTYLKLSDLKLGLLANFNVPLMKDGIRRVVNKL